MSIQGNCKLQFFFLFSIHKHYDQIATAKVGVTCSIFFFHKGRSLPYVTP